MRADVIIIGGGLVGMSTALFLARQGMRCIILEKDNPGRHASGVNAGGLRRLNRHPAEIPLAVAAAEIWHSIDDLVDSNCYARFPGQIRVAESEEDLASLEQRAAMVRDLGYQHEEMIGKEELYRLAPALSPHCVGGLICRDDGFARPYFTLHAFRNKVLSLGVKIYSSSHVDAIERSGRNWYVTTSKSRFKSPVLVNCAGAWAGKIAATMGDEVPLKAGAPMLMVSERLPYFLHPVIGAASRKLSFKQMPNGTLVIGGAHMAELDLDNETSEMNWPKLAVSARTVLALFPQLENTRIVRTWAGIEGFMPDNLPVISRATQCDDGYHAFGFSAHGFQLSPLVGKILSELIIDGETEYPIAPFAVTRFSQAG